MARLQKLYRWLKGHKAQVAVAIFWGIAVLSIREYMVVNDLRVQDLVRQLSDLLLNAWYGPLIYLLAYLLRPLLLFPASALAVLAGNVYGLGLGFLYGLIAGTLSVLIPYLVGRWFAKGTVEERPETEEAGLYRFIGMMQRNTFQSILLMRLLYLPYDTVNFAAGMLRLNFAAFLFATALGNVAGTFALVGIGASIEGDISTGDITLDPWVFVISLAVLVVSILVSRFFNKREAANSVGRA